MSTSSSAANTNASPRQHSSRIPSPSAARPTFADILQKNTDLEMRLIETEEKLNKAFDLQAELYDIAREKIAKFEERMSIFADSVALKIEQAEKAAFDIGNKAASSSKLNAQLSKSCQDLITSIWNEFGTGEPPNITRLATHILQSPTTRLSQSPTPRNSPQRISPSKLLNSKISPARQTNRNSFLNGASSPSSPQFVPRTDNDLLIKVTESVLNLQYIGVKGIQQKCSQLEKKVELLESALNEEQKAHSADKEIASNQLIDKMKQLKVMQDEQKILRQKASGISPEIEQFISNVKLEIGRIGEKMHHEHALLVNDNQRIQRNRRTNNKNSNSPSSSSSSKPIDNYPLLSTTSSAPRSANTSNNPSSSVSPNYVNNQKSSVSPNYGNNQRKSPSASPSYANNQRLSQSASPNYNRSSQSVSPNYATNQRQSPSALPTYPSKDKSSPYVSSNYVNNQRNSQSVSPNFASNEQTSPSISSNFASNQRSSPSSSTKRKSPQRQQNYVASPSETSSSSKPLINYPFYSNSSALKSSNAAVLNSPIQNSDTFSRNSPSPPRKSPTRTKILNSNNSSPSKASRKQTNKTTFSEFSSPNQQKQKYSQSDTESSQKYRKQANPYTNYFNQYKYRRHNNYDDLNNDDDEQNLEKEQESYHYQFQSWPDQEQKEPNQRQTKRNRFNPA